MTETAKTNGTEFAIEKGVPVSSRRADASQYPFDLMSPGDSILVPPDRQLRARNAAKAFAGYRRKVGESCRFTTRIQPDGSRRIWRIE